MKKILFILAMCTILCNYSSYGQISDNFKITKIDSTSSFYLVYAKSFKIKSLILVSKTDSLMKKSQKKVIVGEKYKLTLYKNSLTRGVTSNLSPKISVENKVIWKKGDDFTVYLTDDIENLFYLRKEKQ